MGTEKNISGTEMNMPGTEQNISGTEMNMPGTEQGAPCSAPGYYFAPMEGFTGRIYRRVHHKYFPGIDKYFTPFLPTHLSGSLSAKERREVDPANNPGQSPVLNLPQKSVAEKSDRPACFLIPQLLSKDSGQFVLTAKALADLGFGEINLNLGCPSATVVPKGRGSGMLKNPEALNRFFEEIFANLADGNAPGLKKQIFIPERPEAINESEKCGTARPHVLMSVSERPGILNEPDYADTAETQPRISVKTRLGLTDPAECRVLLDIFNRYDFKELIIHPRTREDFYKSPLHMDYFTEMYRASRNPVVFNGDIKTAADCRRILETYPDLKAVMIGRGLLINPALVREARGGKPLEKEEYRAFLKELFAAYEDEYQSEGNALSKMKDLWTFASQAFPENPAGLRSVKKAGTGSEYNMAVDKIFCSAETF